ncbi:MAG TPA: hypothetical protein VGI95_15120 [Caulobacteraceae bacterium]
MVHFRQIAFGRRPVGWVTSYQERAKIILAADHLADRKGLDFDMVTERNRVTPRNLGERPREGI